MRSTARRSTVSATLRLLSAVLFVTSCVTYEPAASGLVSDQGPRLAPVGSQVPSARPVPDDGASVQPVPNHPPRPVRPFVAGPSPTVTVQRLPGPAQPARDHGRAVRGSASWCAPTPKYCTGWQPPALVAAVSSFRYGDPRYTVTVQGPAGTVTVTVVSYGVLPKGRVIDLSPASFVRACGPLSIGVCKVTVEGLR